jgi:hypothetical protein
MHRWIAAAAATAAGAALLVLAATSGTALAAQHTIEAVAVGAQENPPVSGPGSARTRFVFDDVAKTLSFAVTVNGLSPDQVNAAHIHRGATGSNGPIVHNLSLVGFTTVSGTLTLSDADIADLRAGNFYVNVHSKDNPGGFARAQLILPAAAAPAAAPASAVPAALPRTGSGTLQGAGPNYLLAGLGAALVAAGAAGTLTLARKRA